MIDFNTIYYKKDKNLWNIDLSQSSKDFLVQETDEQRSAEVNE